ncbi:MAG: endolytic transglycosylase MltG [Clostridiales bacterium]|nr:endolytic transglycosylase MltG [Clostridiales bacterium]
MRKRNDTYQSVRDEREYGPYWYHALWRIIRPLLVLAASLLVVISVVASVWSKLYDEYLAPPDAANQAEVLFQVQSGQSLTRVANNLEAAGLIRNRTAFKYYCDFAGMGQKIQAGSYMLAPSMTMKEIAEQLTTGDGNPIVRNITLIPGWTIEEFAAKLVEDGVLADNAEFLSLCRSGTAFTDYYYIADVLASSNVAQRKYVLEGYLSPNTYEVYVTATAEDIIRKLLSQTDRVYPAEFQARAEELNMTMDEVITLASLIQKEAKDSDFAKTSAVFHNRLKKGMKLQSDVTIHYVTGVRKMSLTNADLALNSPYNTYQVTGLPLGPVCNPSKAAIQAALYPDETFLAENYLYFCAKDPESGELHFSRTLQEHEQAVSIYAPLWKEYDAQRGIQ